MDTRKSAKPSKKTARGATPKASPRATKQSPGSSAVEQRVHTPKGVGSNPTSATNTKTPQGKRAGTAYPGLLPKQALFVAAYLKNPNATQAAISAGYSVKTAGEMGRENLGKPRIAAFIAQKHEETLAKFDISREKVLQEIARIAFFDPRRMFGKDGRPLDITELDDDTAAVIAGLDVLEEWDGIGQDRVLRGYVKKWKLADKKGSLDMLMKHLGEYKADNKQAGEATGEALAEFMASLRDSGAGTIKIAKRT